VSKDKRFGEQTRFGLKVVEAEDPLVLPLLQVDLEKAAAVKPDDVNDQANFMSCVLAQAATRVCGAERVAILRSIAYVAFPGEKVTRRYTIEPKARRVLEAYDRGEQVEEAVALKLTPPRPSRRRDVSLGYQKVYRVKHGDERKTSRKLRDSDPLHQTVRNGNIVYWGGDA
jgi:hypothetical protein